MEKILYGEVSSTNYIAIPVSSVVAIDGISATQIEIFYKNINADSSDATENHQLPKITVDVVSGDAKKFLQDLAKAINFSGAGFIGLIDLESLPTAATVSAIGIAPAAA